MRVVVVGATGNVGTSVVRALAADPSVDEIVGVARRTPEWSAPRTRWVRADIVSSPLEQLFRGADAVVHLAWLIQPSRDERALHAVNVTGSRRVFEAAAAEGVGALVYASSIGAYSAGPKDRAIAEDWPTDGIGTSFYSRHKAAAERLLDGIERAEPRLRVVRLRPALIFKREAGAEIRRLFVGPLLPSPLVRPSFIHVVPSHPRLRFQAVHADDVAEAYRLAVVRDDARGAYNVAADPVLDGARLGHLLDARPIRVPATLLRAGAALSWQLRLQPTPPGWVDMAFGVPLLDSTRLRAQLGWNPKHTAEQALLELMEGMRAGAGETTPPLDPKTSGPLRVRELLTGIGGRNP